VAVATHADRRAVAANAPAVGLEEQFRAFGGIDLLVYVAALRLGLARHAAAEIGHAAGPDLLCLLDWRQQRRLGHAAARQRCDVPVRVIDGEGQPSRQREVLRQVAAVDRPAGTVGGGVAGQRDVHGRASMDIKKENARLPRRAQVSTR
jgi:hypothetical protein